MWSWVLKPDYTNTTLSTLNEVYLLKIEIFVILLKRNQQYKKYKPVVEQKSEHSFIMHTLVHSSLVSLRVISNDWRLSEHCF